MNDMQMIEFLLYIFDTSYQAEMFGIVDDKSGIRKAGLRFTKIKEYPDGDEDYIVTVNRDILKRWLGGKK